MPTTLLTSYIFADMLAIGESANACFWVISAVATPEKRDEYLALESQFGFNEQRLEVLLREV